MWMKNPGVSGKAKLDDKGDMLYKGGIIQYVKQANPESV